MAALHDDLLAAMQDAVNVMKLQRDVVEQGKHAKAWDGPIANCEQALRRAEEGWRSILVDAAAGFEARAKALLAENRALAENGGLFNLGWYLGWNVGSESATLDGDFTADDLEAIAWWMRNAAPREPAQGEVIERDGLGPRTPLRWPAAPQLNREELAEFYKWKSGKAVHTNDCATSCTPAMAPGPCDCDAASA